MNPQINMPAIIIANSMGLAMVFCVAVSTPWRAMKQRTDSFVLRLLLIATVGSCIFEPISFYVDSRPGRLFYFASYISNSLVYGINVFLSLLWFMYIVTNLGVRITKRHKILLGIMMWSCQLLLLINFFVPVAFSLNDQNVYSRTYMYLYFMVVELGFLLDGIAVAYRVRRKSGRLLFFPVWAFIIPILAGAIAQTLVYGISTIVPCAAISIGCITISLQNQMLFRDNLTGLCNRSYLDSLEKKMKGSRNEYTAIMIDINRFKVINDTYGHKTGDKALIQVASILKKAVNDQGEVIRYAGDEFIIILNSQDENNTAKVISDINDELDKYNKSHKSPYTLTVSMGQCKLNFVEFTMDDLMDKIDKLMYEEKELFYQNHTEYNRRGRK